MTKSIDFETLKEICKHNKEEAECHEEDNISGTCECAECPVWCDLMASENEM